MVVVMAAAVTTLVLVAPVFVVLVVIAFNLLGDGMRDAADPYGGSNSA